MAEIIYSQADFTNQVMATLPEGSIWQKDSSSNLYQAIFALMGLFQDEHERAANLITDLYPATSIETLPAWESTFGLPDPCAGPAPTLSQRQAQVVSRLANVDGQSVIFLTQFAANLGFTIIITQYGAYISESTSEAYLTPTANYIQVAVENTSIDYFTAGKSLAGDELQTIQNIDVLECELNRILPSTTSAFYVVA